MRMVSQVDELELSCFVMQASATLWEQQGFPFRKLGRLVRFKPYTTRPERTGADRGFWFLGNEDCTYVRDHAGAA